MSSQSQSGRHEAAATTSRLAGPAGLALALLIVGVQLLFVFCLGYPPLHTTPHDLPVGLAGPASAVAPLRAGLTSKPGQVEVHGYADGAAARHAVERREVYGALVVSAAGPRLLVASAADPKVAQALQAQVEAVARGQAVPVTDVVPTTPADPNQVGALTTMLPLILISLALGTVVTIVHESEVRRVAAIVLGAAVAGLGGSGIVHGLNTFAGGYWSQAALLALIVLAVALAGAGLFRLGDPGRALFGLVALVLVNLGIPSSGALVPVELLPEPWRAVSGWLPPGAGVSALRGVGFFDGAATRGPLLLLGGWALVGMVLCLVPVPARLHRAARA